ncbi:MAG TPA: hypothetical protein VE548_07695 [Nitrososphaeraceae archaeon]|jgi:hypothetical protein|nr:hypothetical protein [Nitrososphaeraceae archaeon]
MEPFEFEQFLKLAEDNGLSSKSDSEKIKDFILWCKKKNIEENLLRLSSEEKGGWSRNFSLDFTTTRIIISKKSFLKKFVDMGYVAGIAPFPYMVLSKKLKRFDVKKQYKNSLTDIINRDKSSYYIWYSDIQEFIIRKGIETTVTNMVGTMIMKNFITIKTVNKTYDFTLPVNKNGKFEQIHFWLSVVLPFNVTKLE